jgi:hypothetical protein
VACRNCGFYLEKFTATLASLKTSEYYVRLPHCIQWDSRLYVHETLRRSILLRILT